MDENKGSGKNFFQKVFGKPKSEPIGDNGAPMEPKQKFKMNKMERNWAFYDAGNSAIYMFFILVGVSIGDLTYGTALSNNPTSTMSMFNAISGLLVAALGPILGAIADNKGRKKPMFAFFVFMGVAGCFLSLLCNFGSLGSNHLGFIIPFIICIMMILIGIGGSLMFYDSMLIDVTTEERSDRVSSYGFAYGYIFSCIPFLLCLLLYYFFMDPTYSFENYAFVKTLDSGYAWLRLTMTICLAISGAWWLVFTIPLLKNYKQLSGVEPVKNQIRDAFKKLGKTFKELRKYKYAFLFLLAFFCYINGVNTIITLSATYAKVVLGDTIPAMTLNIVLIVMLLLTQIIACVFSILFGNLSKRFGARNLILISVLGYLAFVIYAVFMKTIVDAFVLATGIGIFQGGIQALSRSYFAKLAPLEKQTEFFGLYDIFNKSSNFLGSALFAAVAMGLGSRGMDTVLSNRICVACLSVFFIAGLLIMFFIPINHADKVQAE